MITREEVLEALRSCNDPEINLNIVDLGFIEEIVINEGNIHVRMILTNPACPFQTSLMQSAHESIVKMKGVETAEVEVLSDPPWTPARLSAQARRHLGIE